MTNYDRYYKGGAFVNVCKGDTKPFEMFRFLRKTTPF